jgi:hypothetical protein
VRLEIAREALVRDGSERDEPQSGRGVNRDRDEPDRTEDLIQER